MNEKIGKPCSLMVWEEILPGRWDWRTYQGTFVSFESDHGHTLAVIRISSVQVKRGWIYNLHFKKEAANARD